ncbi:MAG TPA: 6-phosphogluconolactonase [Phycisphaerales bacterium]|nr:6-phosphogluconolactonase [Phycisphaerales bacterium]
MTHPSGEAPGDSHAGFRLEPEAPAPPTALPGNASVVRPDAEDLHFALGADLMTHAFNCVRAFGDFHLALSGGSTPLPFYRRLMVDPAFRAFPWARTHLWIVDERRVPMDDDRCNYTHIAGYLLDHSGLPESHAHPIRATEPDADRAYERELRDTLAWREKGHDRLDFVLLGMGADGHTASLFPRSPALRERERLVTVNSGPSVTPPDRVTMTYPLINAARFVAVLVTGESKKSTLTRVSARASSPEELPILGVAPVGGVLRWYLDAGACP